MLETALFSAVTLPSTPHLYDVLLAGLVLGRPLHGATPQVHGELRFGLTASKLDRRRRNKPPMQEEESLLAACRARLREDQSALVSNDCYSKNTES